MREVRRIERPRAFQILDGGIELAEFEVGHAELRVGQRIAGARQRGVDVHLQSLIELVQR